MAEMDLQEVQLPDGSVRKLGNNAPSTGKLKAMWKPYGDTANAPLVPRSEWADRIAAIGDGPDFPFLPYVHDQDGIGQCNCDDTAALIESCRMSAGLSFVKLSAGDLYDRINGGSDNGSMLEDAMSQVMTIGIGTAETCGTLWSRRMKTATSEERGRFRVLEAFHCPTFDHCMSAVLCGFRLSTGIAWYDSYTPGSDGWLPRPGGSSGGHAIFGYKPATKGGKFGIWHQNSWGTSWGLAGRFVIPETAYTADIGGWWAVRDVVDEGGVIPTASAA